MSLTPNRVQNSLVHSGSKLIIISKGRIISAKEHVNYITLKDGSNKLTVQISNNSLNKNDINQAVKTIKSQNLKSSKSNTNIMEMENTKINDKTLNSKEKKYFKLLYKPKGVKQDNKQISNIETTKNNNFVETTGNNNKEENKMIEKIKTNKLNIIIPTGSNEENKSSENDGIIDDIIINDNIGNNLPKKNINIMKKSEFKIKMQDMIETNIVNEDEKNKGKTIFLENKINKLDYKENSIEEKNEMKNKLSSKEMSINNNDYIDSRRSEEYNSPFHNNLIDKNNQKTKLSKITLVSKSDIVDNINYVTKEGVVDSAVVNAGDSIKENYATRNLITEMEGDVASNSKTGKDNEDLISDDNNTIKIEENKDENFSEEKDKDKDLEEKKNNEIIKLNNNNIYNINLKKTVLSLNDRNKNEDNKNDNKDLKYRSLNFNNIRTTPILYNMCTICEHTIPVTKLFTAECHQHYFCKSCTKNYFEDIIENGSKEMLCPLIKCKKPVNIESLKNIISGEHFKLLTQNLDKKQNSLLFAKLKTDTIQEDFELYTEKHVLDVDSNKKFFNYNNMREVYCPNCCKNAIFPKSNSHFFKCLNCESKKCRHCLKEFTNDHFDLSKENHCKVYYRYADNQKPKDSFCVKFLLQLFFVLASFYLSFVGAFLLIKRFFSSILNIKDNKKCIKYIFLYLFTVILFLVVMPIIFIFFPVFPSMVTLFDF